MNAEHNAFKKFEFNSMQIDSTAIFEMRLLVASLLMMHF